MLVYLSFYRFWGLLLCLFPAFNPLKAQDPCFNANITRGCAPLTVTMIDCSGAPNVAYRYGNSGILTQNFFTFTQPGKYSITQIIQSGASTGDSLRRIDYVEVLPTPAPDFTVKTCANREVSLSLNDNTYEEYLISWGDNSPEIAVPKGTTNVRHTYLSSQVFSITVKGRYVPGEYCGGQNSILVTPITNLEAPQLQEIVTQNLSLTSGIVELKIPTNSNFKYQILYSGSVIPLAEFDGTGDIVSRTIENLNTENISYCLKIKVLDACANSLETDFFYCNLNLKVNPQDSRNVLSWLPYGNSTLSGAFVRYILYRNEQAFQVFSDFNQAQYIDASVVCNQNYCYRLVAEFNSPTINFNSISNTNCVTSFSTVTPPAVSNFNSSVETPRSIRLSWQVPNEPLITEYRINRNGTAITSNSPVQNALDADIKIDRQICYEIRYQNECGNIAPPARKTCPVFLKAEPEKPGSFKLTWTRYENSENSFAGYVVEKLDDKGLVYDQIQIFTPFFPEYVDNEAKTDRQIMRYRIKTIINPSTNLVSYSNIVEVSQKFKIFFPNAFKPGGINNVFAPKGLFINKFRMIIYDRSGQEMFVSNNFTEGWDGTYKGSLAASGTYVYVVELEDFLGEKFNTKGSFVLIR